jgi:sarcosine oxidase subunit beta
MTQAADGPDGRPFDVAVIGGGVLGAATALFCARGGMRVALIERGGLCTQASGVNAGTLSMQFFHVADLVPYGLASHALWKTAKDWLGDDVGFEQLGGLVLAFTEAEREHLRRKMGMIRDFGSPLDFITARRAQEIEPNLTAKVLEATYCALDGHGNPTRTGHAFRRALVAEGAGVFEGTAVNGIDRAGDVWRVRTARGGTITANRIVLAGGVWLPAMLNWLGLAVPVGCRVQQMVVTERGPPGLCRTILGIPNGRLSVKQVSNGTVLIGGGWIGQGNAAEGATGIIAESFVNNVRLAYHAMPAFRALRIVRSWVGLRDTYPDDRPLIGALPGVPEAYIAGCGISGWTMGPYMGRLLAERILGREPERPLFDPTPHVSALA